MKLRRKDRLDKQPAQTSAKQFEAAVRGFFADELSFNDFLAQMKDLLGRQYALIAHILFLKDATAYVPVDVEPLQAGFKQLGVDLSLTGHCTPVSYQRLLQLLDSVAALISAKEPGVTRLDACMFVRLMGDEAKLAGEN